MSLNEEDFGDRDDEPYFISPEDWETYQGMHHLGERAVHYFTQSWQQSGSHNRSLERSALWSSLGLDRYCGLALQESNRVLLWPPVDATTRYYLQTGIRTVHATLPFTADERQALSSWLPEVGGRIYRHGSYDDRPELADHEPELVERWHEWLWADELGMRQDDRDMLGPSAILAEGCRSIVVGLQEIMDDPKYEPL